MEAPKIMAKIYFAETDNARYYFLFMAIFGFAHTHIHTETYWRCDLFLRGVVHSDSH